MNAAAALVTIAFICVSALALLRASGRRERHMDWVVARGQERADRVYEDFCWHVCRHDAAELAKTIHDGHLRTMAMLVTDLDDAHRRHLEAVS